VLKLSSTLVFSIIWLQFAPFLMSTQMENEAYRVLDTISQNKKKQLIDYLQILQKKAEAVRNDKLIQEFFKIKQAYYRLQKQKKAPDSVTQAVTKLKENLEFYSHQQYMVFYDMLLIDTNGDIFYTIRKQADYHKNIFCSELGNSPFIRRLKNHHNASYIDFQNYKISGEPSAFFVEPFIDGPKHLGWFVLQCAINKINSIFSLEDALGITGETVLVNRDHYLLTDSRFNPDSTILKIKLSEENIESKFRERKGHKSVTDYRGEKVLSSFEVFPFWGTEWLIISKIDRNEVLTDYFRRNKTAIIPALRKAIESQEAQHKLDTIPTFTKKNLEIDMDEYRRTDHNHILYTHGVSSCTAIVAQLPGRFAYLSHNSPYDRIYNETKTDLLGRILKQITHYEVTPFEKGEIEFIIIAPHTKSLESIIDVLIDNGILLSQIKFMCQTKAEYANVYFDPQSSEAFIQWKIKNSKSPFLLEKSKNTSSLTALTEKVIATLKRPGRA